MAGKAHVNDFRKATESDIQKLDVFDVRVPVFNKEIIETLKLRDVKTVAGFGAIMRKQKARNIETSEVDGDWVSIESALVDETVYTNVANCQVLVLGFLNDRTVQIEGEIYGQNEDILGIKQTKTGIVWLCPVQSKCWIFD